MAVILNFSSERFYIFFYVQVTLMLLSRIFFYSIGLSFQEKKRKIDFQDSGHGGHLEFLIGTILYLFYVQVTLMLPSKIFFYSFGLSFQEKKRKIDFQDGGLGFRIGTILIFFFFFFFCSTRHSDASYQVWSQLAFRCSRRSELDFQDSSHDGHDFRSEQF